MSQLPVPVERPRPAWLKWLRRIGIAIAGGVVLLVGIAMIVLPGPAFLMIPAGLAILGLEFAWARVWLKKAREKAKALADKAKK
jgi:uncharacterized protein (TIGR02611 family)